MDPISNPRALRIKSGLNQAQFWGAVGVTQSGGSRYESGRKMPKPVQELLRVVHVEQVNLRTIKGSDLAFLAWLKRQPAYRDLARQFRAATKKHK